MTSKPELQIASLLAAAFRIPAEGPGQSGALDRAAMTLVVVQARAGSHVGLGYTYADPDCASLVAGRLAKTVVGLDVEDVESAWQAMQRSARDLGRSGLAACAVSAVDTALWDLKARASALSLAELLGRVREEIAVHGGAAAPPSVDILTLDDARRLLGAGAVDVLRADATRCGGYTGFLKIAALCEAHHVGLSCHGAPALHVPVACAAQPVRHLEGFHDHLRIERWLFEGAPPLAGGVMRPDRSQAGNGLSFRLVDARSCLVAGELA